MHDKITNLTKCLIYNSREIKCATSPENAFTRIDKSILTMSTNV